MKEKNVTINSSNTLIDFKTLSAQYSNLELIPYDALLRTKEWIAKRAEILKRDGYVCTRCKRRSTKQFKAKDIKQMIKVDKKKIDWFRVGNYLKLPDYIEDGHYWFFSIETLNKSSAYYRDCKYLKYKDGDIVFALIKASKRYFLNIHHKLYIFNKLPWDYLDSDLETICNWCHWELHKTEKVKSYTIVDGKFVPTSLTPCKKCNGAGWFPQYEHVEGGLCFRCLGFKFDELIQSRK